MSWITQQKLRQFFLRHRSTHLLLFEPIDACKSRALLPLKIVGEGDKSFFLVHHPCKAIGGGQRSAHPPKLGHQRSLWKKIGPQRKCFRADTNRCMNAMEKILPAFHPSSLLATMLRACARVHRGKKNMVQIALAKLDLRHQGSCKTRSQPGQWTEKYILHWEFGN